MSSITFLDNAKPGKNSWWRIVLTFILTWWLPIFGIGMVSIIIFPVFSIFGEMNPFGIGEDSTFSLMNLLMGGIFSALSLLFFYISIRAIHNRKIISVINAASKVKWKRILKGAGLWTAILTIGLIIGYLIDPGSFQITFNPHRFLILIILSLMVYPIQASMEELFFRGYLMQEIALFAKKPIIPLISTSLIFGVIHYGNGIDSLMSLDIVIQAFIIGLALGIIALGENGIETAMGVHISNNIFISIICNSPDVTSQGLPSLLTDISATNPFMDVPLLVLSVSVLLLIIFWNKKEKLFEIFKIRDTRKKMPWEPVIEKIKEPNVEISKYNIIGIILGVLILLAPALSTGAFYDESGQMEEIKSTDNSKPFQTYSSDGITFNYPTNWTLRKSSVDGDIFLELYKFDSIISPNLRIQVTSTMGMSDQEVIDQMQFSTQPYGINISNKTLKIDGNTAYEITFRDNDSQYGQTMRFTDLSFVKNGKLYDISISALDKDFDNEKQNFDLIINSFKIQ